MEYYSVIKYLQTTDIHSMGETQMDYAKWKKSNSKATY